MEILTTHFSTEEIQEIQKLPDFAEIKEQIIAKQIDKMLSELDGTSKKTFDERLAAAKDLKEKLHIFMNPKEESKETSFDFSSLSIEALQEQVEKGVNGAKEALEKKQTELLTAGEEKLRASFKETTLGKFIPDSIVDWIANASKDIASEKINGFKATIIGFLIGLIPGAGLFMKGYKKLLGEKENLETGDDIVPPVEGEGGSADIPNGNILESETILVEAQDTLRMSGYRMLGKLSGLPQEGFETEIMGAFDAQGQTLQSLQFKLDNNSSKVPLHEVYGINEKYTNEQVSKVVISLIGPYNKDFFISHLSPSQIQALLGKQPNYTDIANKYFTSTDLAKIETAKYDYSNIPIGILSRLSALSLGKYITIIKEIPGEFTDKLKTIFRDSLGDDDLQNIFSETSEHFPKGVSMLFKDTLTGKADTSTDISFFEDIAHGKEGLHLSEEDRIFLEKLLAFNISLRSDLENYSLGLSGFSEDINANITWQRLLSLYLITGGESIKNTEGFGKIMIYTWMYGSLTPGKQGNYETKILESLAKGTNKDSLILQAVAFQVLEFDRDKFYTIVKNFKGRVDGTTEYILQGAVKYIVPGVNEIENEQIKWIAINLIEAGLLTLALKFLGKMPTTKAVLIATSGVIGSIIYLGIAEGLHKNTSSEIGQTYKKFIDEIAPRIGYENSNILIEGINSGKISLWDVVKEISPEQIAGEELGKIFYNNFQS